MFNHSEGTLEVYVLKDDGWTSRVMAQLRGVRGAEGADADSIIFTARREHQPQLESWTCTKLGASGTNPTNPEKGGILFQLHCGRHRMFGGMLVIMSTIRVAAMYWWKQMGA